MLPSHSSARQPVNPPTRQPAHIYFESSPVELLATSISFICKLFHPFSHSRALQQVIEQAYAHITKMRLLLFLFLFAAVCSVCLAFDWRTVKNTAVACSAAYSIVSWCLWHKQPDNNVTLATSDHTIPFPPNVSLTDSTCDESTIDTNTGDEEQLLFAHADEANVTTAASSNQSTAATRSLPSLQANDTNTTVVATPATPTEQLVSSLYSKQQAMVGQVLEDTGGPL
jgi:hypothetical protein